MRLLNIFKESKTHERPDQELERLAKRLNKFTSPVAKGFERHTAALQAWEQKIDDAIAQAPKNDTVNKQVSQILELAADKYLDLLDAYAGTHSHPYYQENGLNKAIDLIEKAQTFRPTTEKQRRIDALQNEVDKLDQDAHTEITYNRIHTETVTWADAKKLTEKAKASPIGSPPIIIIPGVAKDLGAAFDTADQLKEKLPPAEVSAEPLEIPDNVTPFPGREVA